MPATPVDVDAIRTSDSAPSEDRITLAYEQLRELIVWGKLAPGTRIVEAEVARRLTISRTPVRSALLRLRQEGYVIATDGVRQSRLTVAPLTIEDARELFAIVARVEGLCARRAAELKDGTRAALVERLDGINRQLLATAESEPPDSNRIFDLDLSFHAEYVDAAAGPRLLMLHRAVKPQVERYNRLYATTLIEAIHTSAAEHDEIIDGIRSGDPDRADQSAATNFLNAAERLREVILHLGERGSW
jgi:DNA-binding GntR family transcriptional regulator